MNVFEYIQEMAGVIKKNMEDEDQSHSITLEEHNKQMLNMLKILAKEMENAEFVYEAKRVNHEDYMTFGEKTVLYSHLNDDLLLFQPMCSDGSFTAVDMESIANTLGELHNTGKIKEDMIILPPDVNVLRASLRRPDTPDSHDESDLPDEFK